MPQPKSSPTSAAAKRRTTAAKPKAATAKKPAAKPRASAASKTASTRKPAARTAAAKPKAAPKPAAGRAATARKAAAPSSTRRTATRKPAVAKPAAAKPAAPTAAPRKREPDPVTQLVGALRDQLSDRVFEPLNLVMLAAERIQEAMDEAVERGRMTRGDANDLVGELVRRGREQTDDVLGNLDGLLGKGLDQLVALSRKLEVKAASAARRAESVDRLMRSADRARRAAGVGPAFPILGYDDLSAAKISERLGDLKPADLRKVRDYERAHANRKSVLAALDKALG